MNNQYNNEIPKYLKQKESNVSKAKKKSKHKHNYEECLIQYHFNKNNLNDKPLTSLYSYCTICGKIGYRFEKNSIVTDYIKTVNTSNGRCYSLISGEELYQKYHNKMPVFYVEDILKDGYVNLEQIEK